MEAEGSVYTPEAVFKADEELNKHVFETLATTATGLGVGVVMSLFFKRKAAFINFSTGVGAGVGLWDFYHKLPRQSIIRSISHTQ